MGGKIIMQHTIQIAYSSNRVMGYNQKTCQNTKTIGWKTLCSCGAVVETKSNSIKKHETKVALHREAK
jgi:hypothetical protein